MTPCIQISRKLFYKREWRVSASSGGRKGVGITKIDKGISLLVELGGRRERCSELEVFRGVSFPNGTNDKQSNQRESKDLPREVGTHELEG